ncbi:GerMN domain-containing protein [Lyngbya aestuarii]|uniref:GerMN domain-containing protein n=1 Tax=Lyngbya aestuarii TaxID=118322 RepID=UPI00403DE7BB
MQDQEKARRIPLGVIVGVSVIVLAAGSGAAWWVKSSLPSSKKLQPSETLNSPQVTQSPPVIRTPGVVVSPTPVESPPVLQSPGTLNPSETVPPSAQEQVQVYWLNDVNNQIVLVPSSISLTAKSASEPKEILESAFNTLLAGSPNQELSTTIPQGTKLRNLSVEKDGVHVDLSEEFTFGGGSASMMGRLAQVIYTGSTLEPATKVWIDVEGKRLEFLGGEGLEIKQPMTRDDFKENFAL